ncbi:MAG TPA: SDR family NAD(P)-dependent oxidoreductase [Candidatus Limnocylindrales bacterium]|nr:SDR family NAD(P)-dependent oxidoreductase [Candidatus Limnocylindrales bacterium]
MAVRHPTVVVTGARGAIGSATVEVLKQRGAAVVTLTRPGLDLSSLTSVRATARALIQEVAHIDALLHIAALFTTRYQKSADGFELMLATNHLGPFLLTNLLRDKLIAGGRVITVTAPSTTRVNVDRLLAKDQFSPMHSFGATKAANLMFTFELARRAHRWDVRANAFHPGLVRSELMHEAPSAVRFATRLFSSSPQRAALDLVDLALSPAHAGTTGWLFKGLRHIDAPKATLDVEAQGALWKRSAELVELEGTGF